MADMTPLTDILNDDPATATPVQNNFQTIETYINGTDLIRADGTEVMAANLDLDGNTLVNISGLDMNATKITDLADGTAAGDAVNYGQLVQDDSPLPLGKVGYAQVTSSQTGITTVTDLTSLTVTWTAVTGRRYRTSFQGMVYTTYDYDHLTVVIANSGGTQVGASWVYPSGAGPAQGVTGSVVETGLSGSTTRKLRMGLVSGSAGVGPIVAYAGANFPFYILVEDIGLA